MAQAFASVGEHKENTIGRKAASVPQNGSCHTGLICFVTRSQTGR